MAGLKPLPSPIKLHDLSEKQFRYFVYAIIAVSALLYALRNPQYRTGYYNDDAVYVLGARSLVDGGAFRSLLIRPDYPLPGLPLFLAPLARFVGPHWILLEWLAILITLVAVYLFSRWARKILPMRQAVTVVALFAFNPLVAKFSGILMTGPFYAAGVIASFLLLSQALRKPDPKVAFALGFVLGWTSLLRPEGVLLLISVMGAMLLTPKGRKLLPAVLVPVGLWLIVFAYWWQAHRGPRTEFGGDLAALTTYWPHHLGVGLAFAGHLLDVFLFTTLFAFKLPGDPVSSLLVALILAVCVVGIIAGFRMIWREHADERLVLISAGLFGLLYFGVHIFWHVAQRRYVMPLLPFVLICLVRAIGGFLEHRQAPKVWATIAIVLIGLSYGYRNARAVHESLWAPDPMKSPPWHSLTWLDDHAPSDAQVLSNIAPNVELYTDRPALTGLLAKNREMFLYRLLDRHLAYIVDRKEHFLTPGVDKAENPNIVWDRIRLWIASDPRAFQPVFEDPAEQTKVYQVVARPGFSQAYEKLSQAYASYQAGDFGDALRQARESLRADPDLGSANNLLGAIYLRQNRSDDAKRAFLTAVERQPTSTTALINLASLYRMKGDQARSDEYIGRALALSQETRENDQMKRTVDDLYHHWGQRSGIIFLDAP